MVFMGIMIASIIFVCLVTANFCYIHELEKRIENLEFLCNTTKHIRAFSGSVTARYRDD